MDQRNGIEDVLHPLLGCYLAAPDWVKASAGRMYRSLPESFRLGGAYDEFRQVVSGEGGPGPMARLEAYPFADRCIRCATAAKAGRRTR